MKSKQIITALLSWISSSNLTPYSSKISLIRIIKDFAEFEEDVTTNYLINGLNDTNISISNNSKFININAVNGQATFSGDISTTISSKTNVNILSEGNIFLGATAELNLITDKYIEVEAIDSIDLLCVNGTVSAETDYMNIQINRLALSAKETLYIESTSGIDLQTQTTLHIVATEGFRLDSDSNISISGQSITLQTLVGDIMLPNNNDGELEVYYPNNPFTFEVKSINMYTSGNIRLFSNGEAPNLNIGTNNGYLNIYDVSGSKITRLRSTYLTSIEANSSVVLAVGSSWSSNTSYLNMTNSTYTLKINGVNAFNFTYTTPTSVNMNMDAAFKTALKAQLGIA